MQQREEQQINMLASEEQNRVVTAIIDRHASSYVDPNGYVFEYRGALYRGIRREVEQFYRSLFTDGAIDVLVADHHLVPSSIANIRLDDPQVGLVLQHEKVSPMTYCVEWCPEMLFDAAGVTLDLLGKLLERGAMLQDAYPWNVVFCGPRAVFVDLTSIVKIDTSLLWPAYEQFQAFFLRPLALAVQGKGAVARTLLHNNINGVSRREFIDNTTVSYKISHPFKTLGVAVDDMVQRNTAMRRRLRRAATRSSMPVSNEVRQRFYNGLIRSLNRCRFRSSDDVWSCYYQEIDAAVDKDLKRKIISELLDRIRPKTVVDIGCNIGVFSVLAAERGANVLSVDTSEACISRLYNHAKAKHLPITPIIADILCPTPAFGYMATEYPALIDRARSELILCLALMHHLHVSGRQSFERIARLMDTLSTRYLIFEFVAMEDANNELLGAGRDINYNLKSVTGELARYFQQIEIADSDRPTRKLLICSKANG